MSITLDDIRSSIEAKYASFTLELGDGKTYVARNPLRLPKAKRDALVGLKEALAEDGADQYEIIAQTLVDVAESAAGAKALLKEIDGDFAFLMGVFEAYMETTQAGEASASDD